MTSLELVIRGFFDDDGWDAAEQEGSALLTRVRGEHLAFHAIVIWSDDHHRFTAYALAPKPVPPAHRLNVVDFVTRANNGIAVGNFEVDVRSGELRFRCGMDLHDVPPTREMVRNLVYRAVFALDGAWPGFEAMMERGASVDRALVLVGTLQSAGAGSDALES